MPAREQVAKLKPDTPALPTVAERDAIDNAVSGRFANRQFSNRPVARETIREILDVARFAPSGANIQPWNLYAISGAPKEALSSALQQANRDAPDRHKAQYKYYAAELPEPYRSRRAAFGRNFYGSLGIEQQDTVARAAQTAKNYDFFGAPVGLIVTIDRRLEKGSWLDLGMLLQNIMVVARARGLETCPQETFAKYHKLLRTILPIPAKQIVVCGMSIGFTKAAAPTAKRLMDRVAVSEFAQFIGFD